MSALLSGQPEPQSPHQLRAVALTRRPIANLPFAMIIVALLVIGMAGVVVLTNTIQSQSSYLNELQATESELVYEQAALSAQVQQLRSSQNLAVEAWELGMRPNPHPAFIQLPAGTIVGDQTVVSGNELRQIAPVSAPSASSNQENQ